MVGKCMQGQGRLTAAGHDPVVGQRSAVAFSAISFQELAAGFLWEFRLGISRTSCRTFVYRAPNHRVPGTRVVSEIGSPSSILGFLA